MTSCMWERLAAILVVTNPSSYKCISFELAYNSMGVLSTFEMHSVCMFESSHCSQTVCIETGFLVVVVVSDVKARLWSIVWWLLPTTCLATQAMDVEAASCCCSPLLNMWFILGLRNAATLKLICFTSDLVYKKMLSAVQFLKERLTATMRPLSEAAELVL